VDDIDLHAVFTGNLRNLETCICTKYAFTKCSRQFLRRGKDPRESDLERRISDRAFVLAVIILCAVPNSAVAGWYQNKNDKNKQSSDSDTLSGQVTLPNFDIDGKRRHHQAGVDDTSSSNNFSAEQGTNWKSETQEQRDDKSGRLRINERKDRKHTKDDERADGALSGVPGGMFNWGGGGTSKGTDERGKDKKKDQSTDQALSGVPGGMFNWGGGGTSKRTDERGKDKKKDESTDQALSGVPGGMFNWGGGGTSKRANERDKDKKKDQSTDGAVPGIPGGIFGWGVGANKYANERENDKKKDQSTDGAISGIPGGIFGWGGGGGADKRQKGEKDKDTDQSSNDTGLTLPTGIFGWGGGSGAGKNARNDKGKDQSSSNDNGLTLPGGIFGWGGGGGASNHQRGNRDKDQSSDENGLTLPSGIFGWGSGSGSGKNARNEKDKNDDDSNGSALSIPGLGAGQGGGNGSSLSGLGSGLGAGTGNGSAGSGNGSSQGSGNSSSANSGNSSGAYWQQMNDALSGALPTQDQLNSGQSQSQNGQKVNSNSNKNQNQQQNKNPVQSKNTQQRQPSTAMTNAMNALNANNSCNNSETSHEENGYTDVKEQMNARQLQTQTGTDPAQTHTNLSSIGGMSSPRSTFNVSEGTPQTIAQQQNPNQSYGKLTGSMLCHANGLSGGYGPGPGVWQVQQQLTGAVGPSDLITDWGAEKWPFLYTFETSAGAGITAVEAAFQAAGKEGKPDLTSIKGGFQGFTQQIGNQSADAQQSVFNCGLNCLLSESLINVANEESGAPTGEGGTRTLNNVVWIVMQMYKAVYLPIAILLLLVGAVITQVANTVKNTFSYYAIMESPDAFQGIIRGAGALVLLGMVQLIMSWGIDIGNSMTASITPYVQAATIQSWIQGMNPSQSNMTAEQKAQQDAAQTTMQAMAKAIFSTLQTFLNYGILVLIAYQTVLALYLFLMGPIAAAFYAWPGHIGNLFRPVFTQWINGLINLVLWRFWWCVILMIMASRIQWLQSIGQFDPTNPFEIYVYTAFLAMLMYVPFHALDFRPGDLVSNIQELAQTGTAQQNS
jgi:hypothetical protein